jgi:predicted F0F1-ATPase subunit
MVDLHSLDEITFGYDTLRTTYGIQFLFDKVTNVDFDKKRIHTALGDQLNYDKLVISPGIDFRFEDHDGLTAELSDTDIPHAYKAGAQTLLLRDQVQSMPQGGVFVMSPPSGEFRCPPGPYERASMFAEWMQKKNPTVWMGLGMFGMVGWSIAVPTILGAILGVWLDKTYTQSFSWTLSLMMTGLVVGAVIGWLWVSKEEKEMNKKTEYDE